MATNPSNQGSNRGGSLRGFAAMDPNRQREIASAGGKAAHRSGNAHEFTSEEARAAGRHSHDNDGNRARGASAKSGSARNAGQGESGATPTENAGDDRGMQGRMPAQSAGAGPQDDKRIRGAPEDENP